MSRYLILLLTVLPVLLQAQNTGNSKFPRFGIVTDVHYADRIDDGQRAYQESTAKLQECVDTMNHYNVDFLIELGDFKDMSFPVSDERTLIFLYRIEKVFSGFRGSRYHVLGNHDEDCISKAQFNEIATNTGIPAEKTYYSFDRKGVHFVVLDANYDSTGKDFEKGNFNWGDPNIPAKELKWLRKDLRKARGPVVVFCHQLLDEASAYAVNNAEEARKIMEKSGKVRAVFQGHYHEGKYRLVNGIHYYVLKAVIEGSGAENNSYAIVDINGESIEIKGFRRAQSMMLSIPR